MHAIFEKDSCQNARESAAHGAIAGVNEKQPSSDDEARLSRRNGPQEVVAWWQADGSVSGR